MPDNSDEVAKQNLEDARLLRIEDAAVILHEYVDVGRSRVTRCEEKIEALKDKLEAELVGRERITRAEEQISALAQELEVRVEAHEAALAQGEKALRVAFDAAQDKAQASDDALLLHIQEQRRSVEAALVNLDKALAEKDRNAMTALDSLKSLLAERDKAVEKLEAFTKEQDRRTASDISTRFESVNEFRAQLNDQATRFIPREVAEAQIKKLDEGIANLKERLDIIGGETTTARRVLAFGLAAATLFISGLVVVLNLVTGAGTP